MSETETTDITKLMEAWAEHCAKVTKPAASKVTPIRGKAG